MKQPKVAQLRERALRQLPDLREVVRGSLLERVIRHRDGCPKCAAGDGHPVWVLSIGYPGGRTRQLSLRLEQVPQVRAWLANYQQLKATVEAVCELNQQIVRPGEPGGPARRARRA